uniref:Uncharacterized protein n=1 Tax=Peronospora matthiolae TaxID=2874970 RepID=A0AAV1TM42_9STRA
MGCALLGQVNPIDDICSACPKLTNCWRHMGNTLD